jgi:branched-chain amino acid transport system ATP-binding protein
VSDVGSEEIDGVNAENLLAVEDMDAYYGESQVLFDVSMTVGQNELVGIFGRNGMGKTTLLRSIVNRVVDRTTGTVTFDGEDISDWTTHEIVRSGISYVPEERAIYSGLSVRENLELAAPHGMDDTAIAARIEELYDRFPRLEERSDRDGGTLSGGEQQMLAIARGLLPEPALLLLDEPTEGLAPIIVDDVVDILEDLAEQDRSVLLVEQNISQTLPVISRGYMIQNGRVVVEGDTEDLGDESVQEQYLTV